MRLRHLLLVKPLRLGEQRITLNRSTVDLLVKCLEAGLAGGDLSRLDRIGAMSMLEDCQAALHRATP